jgi:tyrosine-protein phosphatase SIW14
MKHLATLAGLLAVAAGIAAPIVLAVRQGRDMPHFAVVRPGVLYRSGQMTTRGLQRALHDYGIRTVICIREPVSRSGRPNPAVEAERAWCEKNEVGFVRIASRNWDGVPGEARVDEPLRTFLRVVKDPANHPVLVHCFAGTHRTGGFVAVYRMECEGWTNLDAMAELRAMGYSSIDTDLDINEYLSTYRAGVLGSELSKAED